MRLPLMLQDPVDTAAVEALRRYYAPGPVFTGSLFDTWDSTGSREADMNKFTADDLVAVSFLSVRVHPEAAIALLDTRAAEFNDLLTQIPDRDLVQEREPWADVWAGWELMRKLKGLPGTGPTTASKLLARKRPALRPIYDSVVVKVTGDDNVWESVRATLQEDPDLHERLLSLKNQAGLPGAVSAIRVFDVVTWMEGKGY